LLALGAKKDFFTPHLYLFSGLYPSPEVKGSLAAKRCDEALSGERSGYKECRDQRPLQSPERERKFRLQTESLPIDAQGRCLASLPLEQEGDDKVAK
jgi:hypothetical protein